MNLSGVLRLEISLFSGYELFSVNSLPSDSEGSMSELQHGSHANELWFVFANVTSKCPICVQYIVRSAYVISNLRPAFARVYPADREDLAAETFFHSHTGSELLNGITEDDLITWFGKNDTRNITDMDLQQPECRHYSLSTTSESILTTLDTTTNNFNDISSTTVLSIQSTTTNTPSPEIIPLDEISVTTYTINVDSNSIYSNITQPVPTELNKTDVLEQENENKTVENPKTETDVSYSDNIKTNKSNIIAVITKSKLLIHKKLEQISKKTSLQKKAKQILPPVVTSTTTSTTELTTTAANLKTIINSTTKPRHEIKHINKEIHEVPIEYLNDSKTNEEDKSSTFLPDNKEDTFLVVDKDALWGMLKEVVHDELDKKDKIRLNADFGTSKEKEIDGKKLRLQGFT